MDDAQLKTVWQQRQIRDRVSHVSGPLGLLVKRTLGKRVKQLGQLAAVWDEVVPAEFHEHTAMESFSRGVLTVVVDSASRRFQLRSLLDSGLHRQIQERLGGPLQRINLTLGSFYSVDVSGEARYAF